MQSLLEHFLASEKFLRDREVCDLLGWSPETLKAKRARKEAPPSIKVKAIHLTRYRDMAEYVATNGHNVCDLPNAGKEQAAQDILA